MAAAEVMTLLLGAAQQAVVQTLTEYAANKAAAGASILLEWIDRRIAAGAAIGIKAAERKGLEKLLQADEGFLAKLVANLKFADRRGILLVGPSGAGKSRLFAGLSQIVRQKETLSTVEIDTQFPLLAKRLVALRDTPGLPEHGADVWKAVKEYQPAILVLVLANGYLDSVGTGAMLRRPFREKRYRKLEKYLADAKDEEAGWIEKFTELVHTPAARVKYLVVVANKMDLWLHNHADVLTYYRTDEKMQKALTGLLEKIVIPGQTAQVVTTAAEYDSFKTLVPASPAFNQTAARDTVKVLKALLAALLLDGNLI